MADYKFAPLGPKFKHISTATTTLVRTGPGILQSVFVSTGGAGSTATVYDGVDATGAVIAVINTAVQVSLFYGVPVSTGICVVTASGTPADITVTYL